MNELSFIFSGKVTHLSGAVKHFAGREREREEALEFPTFLSV
jgi:hypothetical protein